MPKTLSMGGRQYYHRVSVSSTIQYGDRKYGTHAQMLCPPTPYAWEHGNSKNEIRQRNRETANRKVQNKENALLKIKYK